MWKLTRFYFVILLCSVASSNEISVERCVQCHSSVDPKCATNPGIFLFKECPKPSSSCFVRIIDGHTIRGCGSELDESTFNSCNNHMECLKCSSVEGCNNQKFPLHRISCLQCSGDSIETLCATHLTSASTICPIYKLGDSCYIRHDNRNNTDSFQRGCLSSATERGLCVKSANCYTCQGDGCNSLQADSADIPLARDGSATISVHSLTILTSISYFLATL